MTLRALTESEIAQIKSGRERAVAVYKRLQSELKQAKKGRISTPALRDFEGRVKAARPLLKGYPILAVADGTEIYLEYDLLRKLTRSLTKQRRWYRWVMDPMDYGDAVRLHYAGGEARLLQLHSIAGYGRLPRVELTDADPWGG